MAERDRVALSEVVGAFTQPMHAACAGPPARFAQDLPDFEPTGGSITDMADERLSLALAWSAMEPSTIAEEDRAWLFGIRSEVDADLRAAGSVAGFVHHDYKLNNVLVSGGIDRGFTVTGVVDLQEGYIGDRVQDLARTVNHADRASARAFVEASGGAGERLRLYSAIDSSALWDYGRRNHVWFPEEMSFQDYARPLVDRVAAIL